MPSTTSKRTRPGDVATKTRAAYHTLSMSSVGLEMGIAVILGLLFGGWLDGELGTTPWLMILFTILGFAAGFKGVFRAMREADQVARENEEAAAPEARRGESERAARAAGAQEIR